MSQRNDLLDSEIADKFGVIIAASRGGQGEFRRHTGQALHFLTELAQRDFRKVLEEILAAHPADRSAPFERARKLLAQKVGLDGAPWL